MSDIPEDVVKATMLFVKSIGERETAEFICNQQKAIDGLTANNKDFAQAYRNVLADKAVLEAEVERLNAQYNDLANLIDQYNQSTLAHKDRVKQLTAIIQEAERLEEQVSFYATHADGDSL
jgi:vacuolar-type H+-ATPase subunit I/STV1